MPSSYSLKVVQTAARKLLEPTLAEKLLLELTALNNAEEATKETGEEKPKPVKKLLMVIRPASEERTAVATPGDAPDEIAWVIAYPEDMHPTEVPNKIREAVASYNASKRGRLYPVKALGEGLEDVPARFFKEFDLVVKTRTPVLMVAVKKDIELPSLLAVA